MARTRDWKSKIARLKVRQEISPQAALAMKPARPPFSATVRYFQRLREVVAGELGIPVSEVTNYKLAQRLEIAPNRLTQYFVHGGTMENKLAFQVARILNEDPLVVIAEVEAERASRDEDRAFWQSVARKVAAIAVVAIGASTGLPSAEASPSPAAPRVESLCIMSSWRRALIAIGLLPGDDLQLA